MRRTKRTSWEVPGKFASTVKSEVTRKFAPTVKSEVPGGCSLRLWKAKFPGKFPGSSLFSQFGKFASLLFGEFPKISIVFCFNREVLVIFRRTFWLESNWTRSLNNTLVYTIKIYNFYKISLIFHLFTNFRTSLTFKRYFSKATKGFPRRRCRKPYFNIYHNFETAGSYVMKFSEMLGNDNMQLLKCIRNCRHDVIGDFTA